MIQWWGNAIQDVDQIWIFTPIYANLLSPVSVDDFGGDMLEFEI